MTRVSLTEDYDDRSVIAKLNKMEAIANSSVAKADDAVASAQASAQSAQETADRFAGSVGAVVQNANAQINASKAQVNEAKAEVDSAKAEVDATVSTVAQAVQTANNASSVATQAAGQVLDKVNKTGTDTPQVISGTGGLQIAGDLDVGTDLTVAGNTHLGDQVEVAGMAIEMDGLSTTLSNANGIKVNGKNISKVAVTDIQNHFTDYQYFDSWYTYGPNQLILKGSQPTNWKIIGSSNGTEIATALQFNKDTLYIRNPNTVLPTVSSSSLGVVNKAFVASTDGTNNLLHTEGNEKASGFKQMSVASYAGSTAAMNDLVDGKTAYTVFAELGTTSSTSSVTKRFPIIFSHRYGIGMGMGTVESNLGSAKIQGMFSGAFSSMKLGVANVDGKLCIVGRRTSSAGQGLGLLIPWYTASTSVVVPVLYASDEKRVGLDDSEFVEFVRETP